MFQSLINSLETTRKFIQCEWQYGRRHTSRIPRVGTRLTQAATLRRRVLVRPRGAKPEALLWKLCARLGLHVIHEPQPRMVLAFRYPRQSVFADDPMLRDLSVPVVNAQLNDVLKITVDRVFSAIFGYGTQVDPRTHEGPLVEKSDENARHDGRVLRGPVTPESGKIYQRVIDNEDGQGNVLDLRVPIYRGATCLVYCKVRPVEKRFKNVNSIVHLDDIANQFDADEVARIRRFAAEINLEYGELDILRDRTDGRIYIVDVNPTPWGPPNHLPMPDARTAVTRLTELFYEQFIRVL